MNCCCSKELKGSNSKKSFLTLQKHVTLPILARLLWFYVQFLLLLLYFEDK